MSGTLRINVYGVLSQAEVYNMDKRFLSLHTLTNPFQCPNTGQIIGLKGIH